MPLLSFLFLALTTTAHAQSTNSTVPPELFYNPSIQGKILDRGWSLYGCDTETLTIQGIDPVTRAPRNVSVVLYKSTIDSQKAVILLPPTGGVNVLDRGYANQLCSSGITVAILKGWKHQLDVTLDFSMHDFGALRFISATRHTVEFLRSRKLNSIGLLGTSIGAIGGALAFAVEPRISAITLIVGSARFADVIAESDEEGAAHLREARMKALGLRSQEQYQDLVRQKVQIEPMEYLKAKNKRPAFVITADNDTTVPTNYQHELAQILDGKEVVIKGNHVQVVKQAFWEHSNDIVQFFSTNL